MGLRYMITRPFFILLLDFVMKRFVTFLFFSIGITVLSCCRQKDIIITSFPIEKSVPYSVYDTYDIIDPAAIAISGKYLFLLGMRSDPVFQQYELPNLNYVKSFGRRGRGPGEFSYPPCMYISVNQNKIYICRSHEKIFTTYVISENGDLLIENEFTVNAGMLFNQFHIINDSLLIYNLVPRIGIEKIDLLRNENSNIINFTKNRDFLENNSFHPDYGTLSVNNQYIVYAYKYRKQIDVYDIENFKLKARVLAKGHKEKIMTTEQSKGYYYDVYATDNFIYAYYVDPDSDDKKNKYYVEVFDYMGTPVKRLNIGISLGGLFAVTPNDSVLYSYSGLNDKILMFEIMKNDF